MENLLETYKEEDDEEDNLSVADPPPQETPEPQEEAATPATLETKTAAVPDSQLDPPSEELSSDDTKRSPKRQILTEDDGASPKEEPENDDSVSGNGNGTPEASLSNTKRSPKRQKITEDDGASPKEDPENDDSVSGNGNGTPEASISNTERSPKRQKITVDDGAFPREEPENEDSVSGNGIGTPEASISKAAVTATTPATSSKKSKKKSSNVWVTKTVRKGKKKNNKSGGSNGGHVEDTVLITPVPRFPDKNDDSADMNICLSKVYKAEKVELSEDRMSAGSTKGYRMVRATRGVCEGAWYFEIKVEHLGETGHTRLGWSTEKSDLQAPVGYDGNSFGYRDIDGTKVHKALREKYGDEGYKEGDVIGFYISLPDGGLYAPKPPQMVLFKGQRYVHAPDPKDDPPKVVPGSEISFFKNGVCQGVAFKDLFGGRYYPAASMYTLPDQPNCLVKFNFGPEFEFFPENFDGRPIPRPMVEVPYHGFDGHVENGAVDEKKQ